jgi:hypothetical protein
LLHIQVFIDGSAALFSVPTATAAVLLGADNQVALALRDLEDLAAYGD